jgi:hypothetical protein
MKTSKNRLKLIFSQVIKGFSMVESGRFGKVFVKHMDSHLSAEIEMVAEKLSERVKAEGLPPNEERLEELKKDGLWVEDDDKKLADQKSFLHGLNLTKSKLFRKRDIEQFKATIVIEEKKLREMENKKDGLIGLTVEKFTERKTHEYYIFFSLFKDEALETRLFSSEQFDDLEIEDISELFVVYNECSKWLNSFCLKQVAVSPMFLNFFCLCDDNPQIFYGIPVVNLSFYQTELFGYGRYYKSILSECQNQIPPDVMEDPEKLVEWYEARTNAQKVVDSNEKKENMNVSIVGASPQELEQLGVGSKAEVKGVVNLSKELAKKGGTLTMEDLIKLEYGN